MKQKNMILIAVAVGCGLMAAFLMTQMNAGQKTQDNSVQVPVALKALSVNSPLPKENLDTVIEMKTFNPDTLPPNVILVKDELAGKRVMRMKQPGEFFLATDLSDKATVTLPAGHNMTTVKVTQDELVGGWAVPGTRVDIIASVKSKNSSGDSATFVFPLLQNVLVVAVGTASVAGPNGVMDAVTNVSVAATEKQSLVLSHAEQANAKLRFALRNQNDKPEDANDKSGYVWTPDEDELLVAFQDDKFGPQEDKAPEDTGPKFEVVDMPVALEALPAGTQLTADVLDTKFTMMKVVPPAPEGMISDLRKHQGEYVVKDLPANQYVTPSYLALNMPAKPDLGKAGPSDAGASPKIGPDIEPTEPKRVPVYHDVKVLTASGIKIYRYEEMENGKYVYLGEVKGGKLLADPKGPGGPAGPKI